MTVHSVPGALRLLVVLLTVAFVGSLTACAPAESEFDYLRIQVDGQPTLAVTRKDTRIRGIILYFHGLDQDEFAMTSGSRQAMTAALVDAGFAVMSSKAGGNAFSSDRTIQNYRELGSMARQHFQIDNIYFLADSLGAIPAVNLFASSFGQVGGLAAINPVLSFASARSQVPAFAAEQQLGSPSMQDPMSLPPKTFAGKSVRFYVSPQDSLAPSDNNATEFENRFASTAQISIVPCTGTHDDVSCAQGDDLAKWFTKLDAKN